MELCRSIAELQHSLAALKGTNSKTALVPTMGALHEGHLSLVDAARGNADIVVLSIFVNPTQFGAAEDLSRYPREEIADARLASARGVDVLFVPTVEEIYPHTDKGIVVSPGMLGSAWEGEVRPGHFEGVLTIVAKLLNIVQPELVLFGQKDIQQASLVQAMVADLNFQAVVKVVPTVRDEDGLALSSRNRFLEPAMREVALGLPRALQTVAAEWRRGERSSATLRSVAANVMEEAGITCVDYIAVADPRGLEPVEMAEAGTVVAIAVRVGSTRLLDNLILGEEDV